MSAAPPGGNDTTSLIGRDRIALRHRGRGEHRDENGERQPDHDRPWLLLLVAAARRRPGRAITNQSRTFPVLSQINAPSHNGA